MKHLTRSLLFVSLLILVAGCAGITGRTAGQSYDDTRITAEINAKYVKDPLLSALKVDVDSFQSNVTLMGQVPSKEAEKRAIAHAKQTSGVKSVVSNLIVKPPKELSDTANPAYRAGGAASAGAGAQTQQNVQAANIKEASKLMDMDVKNRQGENLGKISDIIVNSDTGQISYAIMEGDRGFLGMGDRMFAIPWKSFTPGVSGDELILDINKERLASAPYFTGGNWPNFTDRSWETDVYRFYGVTPYWEER